MIMAKKSTTKIKQKNPGEENKKLKKKQNFLVWTAIAVTALNFLLVTAFFIYLYFWIKAR